MCGRYSFIPTSNFYDRFDITNRLPSLPSVFSATPGQFLPVIYRDSTNLIDVMSWGLIPPWAKNLDFGSTLFNARSETIAQKPSFSGSFNSCRCLVPVSGFYEAGKFYTLPDEPVFSLAGIYSRWESSNGDYLPTFCIVTTAANSFISQFHDRMPVILSPQDEDNWLDPCSPSSCLLPLFKPYAKGQLLQK